MKDRLGFVDLRSVEADQKTDRKPVTRENCERTDDQDLHALSTGVL